MKIYQNKKTRTFCFDIDDTICKTKNGDYKNSIPIKYVINLINKLYDEGHYIFFLHQGLTEFIKIIKKKLIMRAINLLLIN